VAQKLRKAQQYMDGVLQGDRIVLAQAITVIESERPADADLSAEILEGLLPHSGKARRIGITGVPGGGKSTLIDALGMHLIRECNQKLAVLTIDPSSPFSGGSILGDKTRMERLSAEKNAFIRPSPARGHLGGVGRRTRETMLLCEAAGYENIFVETVGVGQSEIAVRSMTDFFLLILVAWAGDELQGIKRGILEMVDCIAINKADTGNEERAERARAEYANALHLFPASSGSWTPRTVTISAVTGKGIAELWETILEHRAQLDLAELRSRQALGWMREVVTAGLEKLLDADPKIQARLRGLEIAVQAGTLTPTAAARQLLATIQF
jgi:LAO/AO transport system kinase